MPSVDVTPPFCIEHLRLEDTCGHFTPQARLNLGAGLGTSGLLSVLSDEGALTLLALLSCLTPNGHLHPTASEVASILKVSERQARDRLMRLCRTNWQEMPVVQELPRENGLPAFTLAPALVEHREAVPEVGEMASLKLPPLPPLTSRDAIIAHSRKTYARTRAEAERMVLEQLGHSPQEQEDTPEGDARRRLVNLGVARDEIDRLMTTYPLDTITKQLDWLPHRYAKSPARFVVAAIEKDYQAPVSVIQRNEIQAPDVREESK